MSFHSLIRPHGAVIPIAAIRPHPKMNQHALDEVFPLIDRQVWIVTSAHEDGQGATRRGGMVATWVSQANLDPQRPEMQIAVAKNHYTRELIDGSGIFALHLIGRGQIEHVWNFGIGTGRERDKLSDVPAKSGATGAPILEDCLAWLDCRVFTQLDCGDRVLYWADAVDGGRRKNDREDSFPLCESDLFSAATPQQREVLRNDLERDIAVHRPLHAAWRDSVPRRQE